MSFGIAGMEHLSIRENLTPSRKVLMKQAKESRKFKYIWSYNGDIFARRHDGSPRIKLTNV